MQAEVKGSTLPVLEIQLEPKESVISMHGELSWMTANVHMSQTTKAGSGGLMGTLKRAVGGGGIFLTQYQAKDGAGLVAFAAKVPGHIVPVDVERGQGYLVHRHGWLCGTPGVAATVGLQHTFRGGMWGGDGFVLQKLEGQGRAWVELSGELSHYNLGPGQTMLVHPGHVGMFEDRVKFKMTTVPGIANKVFGRDGYLLVALTGPGQIWLQSMPLPNLAHALEPYLPQPDNG
ncbi:TIGR00266 family protein [Streptacidiphilus sp. PB12-B1b]|uniref:TIGR00266 family protein n=1 Tax=Streptacidiphilus sp. PB12-B1b TaxID=2705012 RepID=UPI0015FE63EF|nr:TIGR00266 family protein [Streptacidiphilus sp. PB12-B1b]QMU77622.1 TIGR00266 family protein [Streptacidiphilus sp. PB12-B1b]